MTKQRKERAFDQPLKPIPAEKRKKILRYIQETLPPGEPRIPTPMGPECRVSVVIPDTVKLLCVR